jgi:molybdate transport system ATP-binding protein
MSDHHHHRLSLRTKLEFPNFRLDVEQEFDLAGVTGLFGPSGSGKSTLLRIIAGFETGATGSVQFAGTHWLDSERRIFEPAHHRPVGFVFQDARLFPHLDVAENLKYSLARGTTANREFRYDEVVTAFDLEPLLGREPAALSGGERQRVAIARTLLTQPELLLLDEPLAALDVGRKSEILPYLESLPKKFGVPAIYVSHAVNEMARLADNVIVLQGGRVSATGPAARILSREDSRITGMPFEPVTLLDVTVVEHLHDLHLTRVAHASQQMTVPVIKGAKEGDVVRLSIRAGDVVLATSEPRGLSVRNVLRGTLTNVAPLADSAFATVSVSVDGVSLKAQLTRHAVAELELSAGATVFVLVKTASFDRSL